MPYFLVHPRLDLQSAQPNKDPPPQACLCLNVNSNPRR